MTYTGDQKREYQREWLRKRRQDWLDENGPCIDCGSKDSLEVDHADAKTKLMRPSLLWSLSPKNPRRIAELAKCVVRCNTCHKAKTKLFRETPHHDDHPHAKLSMTLAIEIRARYQTGTETIRGLARDYGVTRNALRSLLRGETWV